MTVIKSRERFDETVTANVLAQAVARSKSRPSSGLHATSVSYLEGIKSLAISFADDSAVLLPVKNYPELASLSIEELESFEVTFAGSALCLDVCDIHLSIAGLMLASKPLMEMATYLTAARNGSLSSEIKAQASRRNGLKGGRPRKSAASADDGSTKR
jgi:hypothetical protein